MGCLAKGTLSCMWKMWRRELWLGRRELWEGEENVAERSQVACERILVIMRKLKEKKQSGRWYVSWPGDGSLPLWDYWCLTSLRQPLMQCSKASIEWLASLGQMYFSLLSSLVSRRNSSPWIMKALSGHSAASAHQQTYLLTYLYALQQSHVQKASVIIHW